MTALMAGGNKAGIAGGLLVALGLGGARFLDAREPAPVVVYRGLTEDEVKAEYPTIEGKADYRHVSYDEAMAFFDEALAEIGGEPTLRRLQEELEALRDRVRSELSPSGTERPPEP